ncbi:hypothetical protein QFZ87_001478 [Bacillus sp. SLBN-46]|uniref:lasso peptide biosynthesis B2 protein n=1 Tax=Bacillus sp. SLBN-46 TaxID=3042283 RepID=UPI002857178F|nr:lasso peptide biosynthesis B2 protein [Bacillus sp. SLBN-46]MDR6121881.1 hypothetical protein [Bacillus sp. SLBN-46]
MKVLKKARHFFLFDTKTKILLIEAFFFLGWARILKSIPFSKVATSLGEYMNETPLSMDETNRKVFQNISNSINIMSRNTFWESKCLVKAIAAMKMLERRHVESTIYLGVSKDEEGNMVAHAWLRSGSFYITGEEGMEGFMVVGKFAKRINF